MRKILVTGSEGQVGRALLARLQDKAEVRAHDRQTIDSREQSRAQFAVVPFVLLVPGWFVAALGVYASDAA